MCVSVWFFVGLEYQTACSLIARGMRVSERYLLRAVLKRVLGREYKRKTRLA